MSITRLFLKSLAASAVAACLGAPLGYLASFPVGFVFHREALVFRMKGGSISGQKLQRFDDMRSGLIWLGAAAGMLSAQSVFVIAHTRRASASDDASR